MASPRSYFIKERKDRKIELLKFIAKGPTSSKNSSETEWINITKLMGAYSWAWGLRSAKVLEYLDELKLAGAVEINAGKVKITNIGKALLRIE
jgi:hypothetical protein